VRQLDSCRSNADLEIEWHLIVRICIAVPSPQTATPFPAVPQLKHVREADSNLIVDENRQPIGRPWLSLAVHAACSQILTI
jgi:hypothetical protein